MVPALILVDLQTAIDDPRWRRFGDRNNLSAEQNITDLLQAWRSWARRFFTSSTIQRRRDSAYRPGQMGNEFKAFAAPRQEETVVAKRTNSVFIGTDLEARLRAAGYRELGGLWGDHK